MKMLKMALVACAILAASPFAGEAQSAGIVGLGAALPVGANPDAPGVGYQLNAGFEFDPAGSPVALRLETLWDSFPFRYTPVLPCAIPGCSPRTAHERLLAAVFDVVLQPSAPTTRLVPYLIAGVGMYGYWNSRTYGSTVGGPGVNAGLGMRVPRLHAFIEARAHVVDNGPDSIPIAVGLRF
ncbi:MAG: hypothetical protein P8099_11850 [Gemmatimonadota bacterium]